MVTRGAGGASVNGAGNVKGNVITFMSFLTNDGEILNKFVKIWKKCLIFIKKWCII